MAINPHFPNSAVPGDLLHENVILCCGEDCGDLLAAMGQITGAVPREPDHDYRCYRFWQEKDFTLIWSGIGTGCLEPLLFEIFQPGIIRRIILIGTAGSTGKRPITTGEAHLISEAWLGGSAVSLSDEQLPLAPSFSFPSSLRLPSASIVSSDFYYGFYQGEDPVRLRLRDAVPSLRSDVARFYPRVDLVDMECAQFYWLCATVGGDSLGFAAIKGAANAVVQPGEQSSYGPLVLKNCFAAARELLHCPSFFPVHERDCELRESKFRMPSRHRNFRFLRRNTINVDELQNGFKLVEEIKLFWTIQIAVCAVLGYLGKELNFSGDMNLLFKSVMITSGGSPGRCLIVY